MTVTALPHPDAATLVCPACHHATALRGGATYGSPLGVRRNRRCAACGVGYRTIEVVCTPQLRLELPVPADTPRAVLRACVWVCRLVARGRRR